MKQNCHAFSSQRFSLMSITFVFHLWRKISAIFLKLCSQASLAGRHTCLSLVAVYLFLLLLDFFHILLLQSSTPQFGTSQCQLSWVQISFQGRSHWVTTDPSHQHSCTRWAAELNGPSVAPRQAISECSTAQWPLTPALSQWYPSRLAHCLPTCNSPSSAQHTSLVLIHTHSHPKLPSSVTVRADSGGRQADEWRPGRLPERLTMGLWAEIERQKPANSSTYINQNNTTHQLSFIVCCTISCQLGVKMCPIAAHSSIHCPNCIQAFCLSK